MKFTASAFVFIIVTVLANGNSYKFVKVENFSSSNESVFKINSLEISSTRLNFTYDILQPFTKIFVLVKFFIQKDLEFRQIFKAPRIDWCAIMSGKGKHINGILRGLIEAVKEKSPNVFQQCPYHGHYEIINASVNKNFLSIYPHGVLRGDLNITDEPTKTQITMSIILEITN